MNRAQALSINKKINENKKINYSLFMGKIISQKKFDSISWFFIYSLFISLIICFALAYASDFFSVSNPNLSKNCVFYASYAIIVFFISLLSLFIFLFLNNPIVQEPLIKGYYVEDILKPVSKTLFPEYVLIQSVDSSPLQSQDYDGSDIIISQNYEIKFFDLKGNKRIENLNIKELRKNYILLHNPEDYIIEASKP